MPLALQNADAPKHAEGKALFYEPMNTVMYLESRMDKNLRISDCGLVNVQDVCPTACVALAYATGKNVFGTRLYECNEAWLLEETAHKLADAVKYAGAQNFRIIVLDAYRPCAVQQHMWELFPDATFVAPPDRGSLHNRGAAVDVWLADATGAPLPMPSDFDEFSPRAAHDYCGGDAARLEYRNMLRSFMEQAGFRAYKAEWWHYNDLEQAHRPVLNRSLCALHEEHAASYAP